MFENLKKFESPLSVNLGNLKIHQIFSKNALIDYFIRKSARLLVIHLARSNLFKNV